MFLVYTPQTDINQKNLTKHEHFNIFFNVLFPAVLTLRLRLPSSGVQHVPGDSGRLRHGAQRRSAGLAFRPSHPATEEDGCRPAGLSPGQSPEGPGYHKV